MQDAKKEVKLKESKRPRPASGTSALPFSSTLKAILLKDDIDAFRTLDPGGAQESHKLDGRRRGAAGRLIMGRKAASCSSRTHDDGACLVCETDGPS